MDKLFLTVLNMSLTASFVIAAIMLARLLLKKAPKIISYALWVAPGFRLVFPFSFESVFSLMPFKSAPIPLDIATQTVPRIDSGIAIVDNAMSGFLPAATPSVSVNPLQIWQTVGSMVWFVGIAVMLIYSLVSIFLLRWRLNGATLVEGNICETDNFKTPFVLGLFRPTIYIPTGLSGDEERYIILHERTHIRRCDHIVKFFAYFVLCLHWFNPLAWAAFLMMGADMEMSCDERVLKEMGGAAKKAYSMSLLSLSMERRIIGGSPLAFGEGGVKERVKNVLNFKKPSRIIVVTSVVLALALAVGFAVNRADSAIRIPEIYIFSANGSQAEAVSFGYTWDGGVADALTPLQHEYGMENTVSAADGEAVMQINASDIRSEGVKVFHMDGTEAPYDSDSLSLNMPSDEGEYVYVTTVEYEHENLKVEYGFKVVVGNIETTKRAGKPVVPQDIWIDGGTGSQTPNATLTSWLTEYLNTLEQLPENHEQAIVDFEITSIETADTIDNGNWLLGYVTFGLKVYGDPNNSVWLAGNGGVGTGSKTDWIVDKRQEIVLYHDIDGTWHCEGYGTGGYDLDDYVNNPVVSEMSKRVALDAITNTFMFDESGVSLSVPSRLNSLPIKIAVEVSDIDESIGNHNFMILTGWSVEGDEIKTDTAYSVPLWNIGGKGAHLAVTFSDGETLYYSSLYVEWLQFLNKAQITSDDIELRVKNTSVAVFGLTLILENRLDKQVMYGVGYKVEKLTDGKWADCDYVLENGAFTDEGYTLPARESREQIINWEWLYGKLEAGHYRITKDIILTTASDEEGFSKTDCSVEFDI